MNKIFSKKNSKNKWRRHAIYNNIEYNPLSPCLPLRSYPYLVRFRTLVHMSNFNQLQISPCWKHENDKNINKIQLRLLISGFAEFMIISQGLLL